MWRTQTAVQSFIIRRLGRKLPAIFNIGPLRAYRQVSFNQLFIIVAKILKVITIRNIFSLKNNVPVFCAEMILQR